MVRSLSAIRFLLVIIVCATVFSAYTVQAQQDFETPLIFDTLDGLFKWTRSTGELQPLDECPLPYGDGLRMSPDGRYLAALVYAPSEQKIDRVMFARDMFICDLVNGGLTQVSTQVPVDGDTSQVYQVDISRAAWSADSRSIAWVEYAIPNKTNRLIRYDLDTGEVFVAVPDLGEETCCASEVHWSDSGQFFVHNVNPGKNWFMVYNSAGEQIIKHEAPEYADGAWVDLGGREMIAIMEFGEDTFRLLDPATGEVSDGFYQLEFISRSAPDGVSVRYRLVDGLQKSNDTRVGGEWTATFPGLPTAPIRYDMDNDWHITISAEGDAVAYGWGEMTFGWNEFIVQYADVEYSLENLGDIMKEGSEIVWGATAFRAVPAPRE